MQARESLVPMTLCPRPLTSLGTRTPRSGGPAGLHPYMAAPSPGLVGRTFRERPAGGAGVEEKGRGGGAALRPEEEGTAEEGTCQGKADGVRKGGRGVRLRPKDATALRGSRPRSLPRRFWGHCEGC